MNQQEEIIQLKKDLAICRRSFELASTRCKALEQEASLLANQNEILQERLKKG